MEGIKAALEVIKENSEHVILAHTGDDIEKARRLGKAAIFPQIQGADCIEENISQLDEFEALGLRVLQLTHHYGNLYAGGALDKVERGLTPRGYELISRMNQLHMLIDVSHSSPQSAKNTLRVSQKPIAQTHGAARAIVNHARCTPDDVIRGIGEGGGVFGVFMMSFWLTTDDIPKPGHYIRQIKHIANIAGVEGVGISNDYQLRGDIALLELDNDNSEGIKNYLPWWESLRKEGILGYDHTPKHVVIPELNHIDRMDRIHSLLLKDGFKAGEADKIMGGNWQRLLKTL
jgi:membrane dipeptidase